MATITEFLESAIHSINEAKQRVEELQAAGAELPPDLLKEAQDLDRVAGDLRDYAWDPDAETRLRPDND